MKRQLAAVLSAVLVSAGALIAVTAGSAGAATIDVGPTEEDLRQALLDAGDATNTLNLTPGTTYVLDDCAAGDLDYPGPIVGGDLTIVGGGSTIQQTCAGERVLDYGVPDATLRLEGVTLTGGDATGANGGGVFGGSGGTVFELVDTTVTGNNAEFGGGVSLSGSTNSISLVRSTVSGNQAGDFGGGIFSGGALSVVDSTVSGNEAASFGGGIFASFENTFVNSTVSNNTAPQGGGIFSGAGGATFAFTYTTIVDNSAGTGANIFSGGGGSTFTFFGNVVTLARGGGDSCLLGAGAVSSLGYNFGEDATCGFGAGPGDITDGGDPLLAALADNGGPTLTRLPAADSPLLEQIPAAECGGPDGDITTDQRGLPRPGFELCDIGAVELQPEPPVPPEPIVIVPTFTG
jgi:predicted outer membrane repeat protein